MAVTFRSSTSQNFSAVTNWVLSRPAGTVDGDTLLAFISTDASTSVTLTIPPGWTLANEQFQATGTDMKGWLCWRVASSEPATTTFSFATIRTGHAFMLAYSGGHATVPINANDSVETPGFGASFVTPTITPTVDNCMLVVVSSADVGSALTWTPPSGMTERIDETEPVAFVSTGIFDEIQPTAAAVTKTATLSASDRGVVFIAAIAPVASGSTSPSVGSLALIGVGR